MLAFASMALMLFVETLRGRAVSLRPALLIAVAYLLFGAWALAMEPSPFPGVHRPWRAAVVRRLAGRPSVELSQTVQFFIFLTS